jgi:tetratricopeptide (TPR) repeat protein
MFIEAYDWMARIYVELKDLKTAEDFLQQGLLVSPKSAQLLRKMGNIALINGNYNTAIKSFNSALLNSKNSFFRDYRDYIGLAKACLNTNAGDKGLKVLEIASKEYKVDQYADLHISAVMAIIFNNQGLEAESKSALTHAFEKYNSLIEGVSTEASIDMANALYLCKDKQGFLNVIQNIIGNNTDNEGVLSTLRELFKDPEIKDELIQMINTLKNEVNNINNKSPELIKSCNWDEAFKNIEKALSMFPKNMTLNLRAASIYIMFMQKQGVSREMSSKTGMCLNRIKQVDNLIDKYMQLSKLFENLLKG